MKSKISWIKFSTWFALKPKISGLIVFVILNVLTVYSLLQRYESTKEVKRNKMILDLQVIQQNIDQSLKNCYTTTLSMALTIDDNGLPKDFKTIAAQLITSNSTIEAVQLAPDGIVQYTYPLKGNEHVIGLNILKSKSLKDEALTSILLKKMYFAGPIDLIHGGKGIEGILPVYNNNRFWGFSVVILKLDTLLVNSGANAINNSEYYFQFSKSDPATAKEIFYLPKLNRLEKDNFVCSTTPDGNWKLYLIDKNPNSLYWNLVVPALLGLLVSLWFGYCTFLLVKKPAELQILIKQQATKLFKSDLQFKTIFEQAGIGIAVVDVETGRFLAINDHFCKILGYSEIELKEKSFKEITYFKDLDEDLIQVRKINSGQIDNYSVEKRYINKEGNVVWASLTATPLWNEDKKHIGNIAFVQDITARKTSETLVLRANQKNKALINTIDGIVWEADAEVNFTFISEKVEAILGYTSADWLSYPKFWVEHIHPEDRDFVLKYCLAQTESSLDHDFEYRMIAKNGDIVWLRDIVNLEMDNNGKVLNLRGIMIDITKTKEIETELNKSLRLVTEQNKRLLNFSYIVSHNLRSHTSNITSIIDLIATSESKEEIEHMVQLLKTVSNSLNETMLNLNEVVNIQTNTGLLTKDLNLQEYVDNAINVLSEQITAMEAVVETDIAADAVVHYNPAYLESVLYNLISNAIRYSSTERKPIVTISLIEEGENKMLQVADNGIGIDLERNGNKIFGMYKTFTTNKDSKGIGLFITKNQIEAMGGQIIVESEVNQGTIFKINIA